MVARSQDDLLPANARSDACREVHGARRVAKCGTDCASRGGAQGVFDRRPGVRSVPIAGRSSSDGIDPSWIKKSESEGLRMLQIEGRSSGLANEIERSRTVVPSVLRDADQFRRISADDKR